MFKIRADFTVTAAQQKAVDQIVESFYKNKYTTLLGVTGSGKTFVMAKVIEKLQKPALIISHNKVLAAQLFGEFKNFFPNNQVEYFISYYDFYRPEAYIPQQDLYMEKEAVINMTIDKLRHRATQAAMSNPYSIIVSSVSCIYNLGPPDLYQQSFINLYTGQKLDIDEITQKLVTIYYQNNEYELNPGDFRIRGNILYIFPAGEDNILRIDFDGNYIENLFLVESVSFKKITKLDMYTIYPAKLFVTTSSAIQQVINQIQLDLDQRYKELLNQNKVVEAERLKTRVTYDISMLSKFGTCPSIEHYSRYLSGRPPNSPPYTLLDYFSNEFAVFIDESHVTIPQLKAMYKSDRKRKEILVEYGFRLPSCLDNRPLKFEEFLQKINKIIFISATPGEFEIQNSQMIELLVRPSGIIDPEIIIQPNKDIVKKIMDISTNKSNEERIIINVLTQKNAEDLCQYLLLNSVSTAYLHSKVKPLERIKILLDFRKGIYQVLVGVNLLREGLDLPEVSKVIILDGDKQGFLRSKTSIIQLAGRAARNKASQVIIFADYTTKAINEAINEVERRRKFQIQYNIENGIIPTSIPPKPKDILKTFFQLVGKNIQNQSLTLYDLIFLDDEEFIKYIENLNRKEILDMEKFFNKQMKEFAKNMEFEQAIVVREKLKIIKDFFK
ncbi:MAG: excinuclease ABC subunit UvrB [bacterium]